MVVVLHHGVMHFSLRVVHVGSLLNNIVQISIRCCIVSEGLVDMAAYGILPDPDTGGAEIYRDAAGNPTFPPDVQNAYPPAPGFISTCELTAVPASCDGRIEAKQVNAIVSELLALAECFDPDGPWDCNSLTNLCAAFNAWVAAHCVYVDNVSIVGTGTAANPYRVNLVDCGSY